MESWRRGRRETGRKVVYEERRRRGKEEGEGGEEGKGRRGRRRREKERRRRRDSLTIIPAINLDAATPLQQCTDVGIIGRASSKLIGIQVRVVTRVDEIVRQRLCHILQEKWTKESSFIPRFLTIDHM